MRTRLTLAFVACTLFLTGCTDKENPFDSSKVIEKSEYFDFSTSKKISINIDLGPQVANEVICLYANPLLGAPNGRNDLLFSCFLDSNGSVKAEAEIPAHCKNVYACCPLKSAVKPITATVNGNNVTIKEGSVSIVPDNQLQLFLLDKTPGKGLVFGENNPNEFGNFYCLGDWKPQKEYNKYRFGAYKDVNGLLSRNELVDKHAKGLFDRHTFFIDSLIKAKNFHNIDEHYVNYFVRPRPDEEVIGPDGHKYTKKFVGEEVNIALLGVNAAFCNTFGYYVYDIDNPPTNEAQGKLLDKVIIAPCVGIPGRNPFDDTKSGFRYINSADAPFHVGDVASLLYRGSDGKVSRMFPVGKAVGFWMQPCGYNHGYKYDSANKPNGIDPNAMSSITLQQKTMSYVPEYGYSGTVKRFFINSNNEFDNANLTHPGGYSRYAYTDVELYGSPYRVLGIEDGTDSSFNDITFVIQTVEVFKYDGYYEEDWHIEGTYAFEDIWPNGGDFDLNDMVIEHWQKGVYDNENNLISIMDRFDIVSPESSAVQNNGFAVHFENAADMGNVSNMIITNSLCQNNIEASTNSVILFTDQHQQISAGKTSIMMIRDFHGSGKKVTEITSLQPYLISNADQNMGSGRCEVHYPGTAPTSLGKRVSDDDLGLNWYANRFLSEGCKFPFAVKLKGIAKWNPAPNDVCIEDIFLHFREWANSAGALYPEWYYNEPGYDIRY